MYLLPVVFVGALIGFFALGGKKKEIVGSDPIVQNILVEANVLAIAEIKAQEGLKLEVYKDTLGNPTVAYGHLVLASDGLKVGDTITQEQADALLVKDYDKAFGAAVTQATELNKIDAEFIAALTSVNYQLGTGWRSKFPNTWGMLKAGDAAGAIQNLKVSKWNEQTPVRVSAFVGAIQNTYA